MARSYNRVMAGPKSSYIEHCIEGGFIGADYEIHQDLGPSLTDDWREFNSKFIPVFLENRPDKTRIGAGLACGFLWTVSKGLKVGDIVISPNGKGQYHFGEITGDYFYCPGEPLPHRRKVVWNRQVFSRSSMSPELQGSTNSTGTCCNISKYGEEIESLMGGSKPSPLIVSDPNVENPLIFAIEKHLEDFLVSNWSNTDLGKEFDIYAEDGELVGQQFQSDTGPIDILATSKDGTKLLVVELKKGRASDVVVGQIQRYMGFVIDELAEPNQTVHGVIIALEDDLRMRRALRVCNNISFYRYELSFSLLPITTPSK